MQDKASFGFIGITFLSVLFGSIFLNDLIKVCYYYYNGLREWWREKKEQEEEEKRKEDELKSNEVRLDMINQNYVDELEQDLESVYFKLVKVNARNRRNDKTPA